MPQNKKSYIPVIIEVVQTFQAILRRIFLSEKSVFAKALYVEESFGNSAIAHTHETKTCHVTKLLTSSENCVIHQ